MEEIGSIIKLVEILALTYAVALIGIWTEISRLRRANERIAREHMEEMKRIEKAIAVCANLLSRSA